MPEYDAGTLKPRGKQLSQTQVTTSRKPLKSSNLAIAVKYQRRFVDMAFNAAVIVGFCVFIFASSNALPATDKVPSGVIGAFNYVNNTALGAFGGTASPSAAQV